MYSDDFRGRVSTYERMRNDQARVNKLLSKSRELKKKMKDSTANRNPPSPKRSNIEHTGITSFISPKAHRPEEILFSTSLNPHKFT
jgi:hypothetical protein